MMGEACLFQLNWIFGVVYYEEAPIVGDYHAITFLRAHFMANSKRSLVHSAASLLRVETILTVYRGDFPPIFVGVM